MVSLMVLSCFLGVIVARPQTNRYLPPSKESLIPPYEKCGSSDTNPVNPSPGYHYENPNVGTSLTGNIITKNDILKVDLLTNSDGLSKTNTGELPDNGYVYDKPDNVLRLKVEKDGIFETKLPEKDETDPPKDGYVYNIPPNECGIVEKKKGTHETKLPSITEPMVQGDTKIETMVKQIYTKAGIFVNNDGTSKTNTRTPPNTHINEEKSGSQHPTQKENLEPIVTKSVYKFTPPIQIPDKIARKESSASRPEKHYRLVFITAPEYHNSAAQQTNAQSEEKTLIYVLSKQPDALEDIATTASIKHSKPEVAYIKYKTHEEAEDIKKKLEAEHNGPTYESEESPYKIIDSILEEGTGKATTHRKDSVPKNIDKSYLPSSP